MHAFSDCTSADSARINASFSAWLSSLRVRTSGTRSLNRVARDRVNRYRVAAHRSQPTPAKPRMSSYAVTAFAPLLGLLAEVPDPRRAQGQIYKLPHVL